ncbi:hypothetical protein PG996_002765 [Apiospora saccharicola]|uniref:Uncharacterized protein n=1 Tax=Apiospora saccharicola TaxID=335842 RepID=A0ABR1WKF9_9PEZI
MRFSGFSTAALAAFSFGVASANPIAMPEQDAGAKRDVVGGLLGGGAGADSGNGGASGLGLNLLPEITSKVEGILGHVVGGLLGGVTGGIDLNAILNSGEALTVLTRVEGIVGSVASEGLHAVDWVSEITDGLLGIKLTFGGDNDVLSGVVDHAVDIVGQVEPLLKGILGGTASVTNIVKGLSPILGNVGNIVSKLTGSVVAGTTEEIESVLKQVTGTVHGLVSGVLSGTGGLLKLVTGLIGQGSQLLSLTGLVTKSFAQKAALADLVGPLSQTLKFLQL